MSETHLGPARCSSQTGDIGDSASSPCSKSGKTGSSAQTFPGRASSLAAGCFPRALGSSPRAFPRRQTIPGPGRNGRTDSPNPAAFTPSTSHLFLRFSICSGPRARKGQAPDPFLQHTGTPRCRAGAAAASPRGRRMGRAGTGRGRTGRGGPGHPVGWDTKAGGCGGAGRCAGAGLQAPPPPPPRRGCCCRARTGSPAERSAAAQSSQRPPQVGETPRRGRGEGGGGERRGPPRVSLRRGDRGRGGGD